MTDQLAVLDTLSDRRDVWSLLHRLPPASRVAFLADVCQGIRPVAGRVPAPTPNGFGRLLAEARRCDRADEMLTNAVYADLLQLFHTWNVDAVRTATRLEALARRS